ncbi:hypothetical protein C823_005025 [Eubacterium plexicaudatum ASF492]|uniref:Uncharacterized protein n=1 Tax=Eubacterium plexicaudatum ASF492 TaxID=1235802 RepID=N1ZKW4_9FIRM|nr:hypothetical protein C823_005025 [Eubacterium plexicaudatum ASF492]
MTDPVLSVSYATIASFFEATEGNYRNAMYVMSPVPAITRRNPDAGISCLFRGMTAARFCFRSRTRKPLWVPH